MMRSWIVFGLLFSILTACGGKPQLVEPEFLIPYQSDSSFHNLWYMGSDDSYHYFHHLDKVEENFKVHRSKLNWPNIEKIGGVEEYILVLPGTIENALSNEAA